MIKHRRTLMLRLFLLLLVALLPLRAQAEPTNRLQRIRIVPHAGFTRITFYFQDSPEYTLTQLPGRVKLSVKGANSPRFAKLRSHSDPHLGGVVCRQRGDELQVFLSLKQGDEAKVSSYAYPQTFSLDVGPSRPRSEQVDIVAGREPILKGTQKLVRDFGLPPHAGLPFAPTDPKKLRQLLSEQETQLFQRGEGLLYKEQGGDAVEIFSYFIAKVPAVKALAWYRLGQAYYLMERYEDAVKAFREGEKLLPSYLDQAPDVLEGYADARARAGDYAGGRGLMGRLVGQMAATSYVAPLINRLADITSRHGDEGAAVHLYQIVQERFPGTTAAGRARVKLADREMFSVTRDGYQRLMAVYQETYDSLGDNALRDEALFKVALLQSLYGPAQDALAAVITYERRYPRGIFATVIKNIREELLLPVYREIAAGNDKQRLVTLASDNKEYLSRCFSDPQFAVKLSQACHEIGALNQELSLFGYFSDKSWAAGSAPFLLEQMVEDARSLGRRSVFEDCARSFLSRFPSSPRAQHMREYLGGICYQKGDQKEVIAQLAPLNAGKAKAEFPESDYYLGKALAASGDKRGGERAFTRFIAGRSAGSPFLPDAWLSVAASKESLKDYRGALAAYKEGVKFSSGEAADQILYKMGELYLQLKMVREASASWERIVKQGSDGTWRKMAGARLSDLEWRLKMSKELPSPSK